MSRFRQHNGSSPIISGHPASASASRSAGIEDECGSRSQRNHGDTRDQGGGHDRNAGSHGILDLTGEVAGQPHGRVRQLIESGCASGVFRDDLPVSWMVADFHSVVHGAATEITAGRLTDRNAAALITTTLLAAYAPQPAS